MTTFSNFGNMLFMWHADDNSYHLMIALNDVSLNWCTVNLNNVKRRFSFSLNVWHFAIYLFSRRFSRFLALSVVEFLHYASSVGRSFALFSVPIVVHFVVVLPRAQTRSRITTCYALAKKKMRDRNNRMACRWSADGYFNAALFRDVHLFPFHFVFILSILVLVFHSINCHPWHEQFTLSSIFNQKFLPSKINWQLLMSLRCRCCSFHSHLICWMKSPDSRVKKSTNKIE